MTERKEQWARSQKSWVWGQVLPPVSQVCFPSSRNLCIWHWAKYGGGGYVG